MDVSRATVVDVVDTREIEWVGDRPRRARGSGVSVSCALCGRPVEVHTILRLEGQEVVIGGSCAKLVAGGGRVRTTVVPDYHALARGNGWTLWRQNGTDNARLAGRNAAHPAVLALVARDYPGLTLDTGARPGIG